MVRHFLFDPLFQLYNWILNSDATFENTKYSAICLYKGKICYNKILLVKIPLQKRLLDKIWEEFHLVQYVKKRLRIPQV